MFHDAALRRVLNSPNGGVARDLGRRAQQVADQAKQNASVFDGVPPARRSSSPGLRVVTGRGRNSITFVIGKDGKGVYARAGTNVPYMAIQELQGRYTWLARALTAAR